MRRRRFALSSSGEQNPYVRKPKFETLPNEIFVGRDSANVTSNNTPSYRSTCFRVAGVVVVKNPDVPLLAQVIAAIAERGFADGG